MLDLDKIESEARDSLRFGGDRKVAQHCLELVAEVRRYQEFFSGERTVKLACAVCDYEIEVDPSETFLSPDRPWTQCTQCGSDLTVSEGSRVTSAFEPSPAAGRGCHDQPVTTGPRFL